MSAPRRNGVIKGTLKFNDTLKKSAGLVNGPYRTFLPICVVTQPVPRPVTVLQKENCQGTVNQAHFFPSVSKKTSTFLACFLVIPLID